MADQSGANALTFHTVRFEIIDQGGTPWLRLSDVARAIYQGDDTSSQRSVDAERAMKRVYASNAAEFTPTMTALMRLPTAGGEQEVRIFSLRGAHLLGMFARTKRAKEFRGWVLDILEDQAEAAALPQAVPAPGTAMVAATLERLIEERNALRAMLAERLLKEEPRLRRVIYYYGIQGLTHKERATLMGWRTEGPWFEALKRLAALGLVDYRPNEALVANGRRNFVKMQAALGVQHQTGPDTPTHPSRLRPGRDPAHMARMRAAADAKRAARKERGHD